MTVSLLQTIPRPAHSQNAPRARHVRVALAGCGVVGSELARLIDAHAPAIESAQHIRLEVVSVLVRDTLRARSVPVARNRFTNDVPEFLASNADIVVEAIGGLEPAGRIARATLARGGRLVTANKALIADAGDELVALARTNGARIDFEAAVGGGIPIIRSLRNSLRDAPVQRIAAILNGTTNFILTRIEEGASFADALAAAQAAGFAEADPTRDLDGTDSADKLRILAWLAFGLAPRDVDVRCIGVLPDPEALVREAHARGEAVRLVARCERQGARVTASVQPLRVPRGSLFARTIDEQNVISLDLGWNQPIVLSGPGAGGRPTATALLGDLVCS